MRVYAESNFVLEIALEQEQATALDSWVERLQERRSLAAVQQHPQRRSIVITHAPAI